MEIRVLQYFLAVAEAQSITGAAEVLHLSQPTLSRQIRDMEEELGKQLFIRGSRKITLTDEGMLLRKRAEEIVDLVRRAENEIIFSDDTVTGDIYIGTGETDAVRLIARAAKRLQAKYPLIHFHIVSGDAMDIIDKLDKGLFDFGILLGDVDVAKYDCSKLPLTDVWGVLMRRDSPLAEKNSICPRDLWDKPLIISRQAISKDDLPLWLEHDTSKLNIAATYNLVYNASLMVDEGMGYALCLDKLINTGGDSSLCFRHLNPPLKIDINIIRKKHRVLSKAAENFFEVISQE